MITIKFNYDVLTIKIYEFSKIKFWQQIQQIWQPHLQLQQIFNQ